MQVGDHMQVIFFACKGNAPPLLLLEGLISTIQRDVFSKLSTVSLFPYLLQVYSGILEIVRGTGICIRGQRSCGRLPERGFDAS